MLTPNKEKYMTNKKIGPAKDTSSEGLYDMSAIDDIYQSAFSSYGSNNTDYSHMNFDTDNYAYEAY
jgi:hypothetical protein